MVHVEEEQVLTWYQYIIYASISFLLVCAGGLMSGLTLGLLSLDQMSIKILKKTGSEQEKKYASRLFPILKHHHWLLVTLLLWNAAAMEALPLFLNKIVPEYLAIILSVTFVLIFGEVIPQAAISRFGLAVGGNLHWFVWIAIYVASPAAWPISKVLDLVLGENHTTFYKRAELKELIGIHGEGDNGKGGIGLLTRDEVMIIRGALEMRDKTISSIMMPFDKVFMLEHDEKMEMSTIKKILVSGHSRIPVYTKRRTNITGVMHVKSLIEIDPDDAVPVHDIKLLEPIWVDDNTPIWDMLNIFQTGRGHLAFVKSSTISIGIPPEHHHHHHHHKNHEKDTTTEDCDCIPDEITEDVSLQEEEQEKYIPLGIVTMEDVFEELIQEEIHDEADIKNTGNLIHQQARLAEMIRKVSTPIPQSDNNNNPFHYRQNSYVQTSNLSTSHDIIHKHSKSIPHNRSSLSFGGLNSYVSGDYFSSNIVNPEVSQDDSTPLLANRRDKSVTFQ
ncbi:DUF21 domain-containing protein [Acrasis kona]|uniref:DUF21 domain-containing protein n=1 Tax=Acrasis kona TaxID=1008807 RepID=A0AAW2Z312_9EUKA